MFRREPDWPVVQSSDSRQLDQLLDRFFAISTIGAAQPVVEGLVALSGSRAWQPDRSIWLWFAAWCKQARELRVQLTAAKIVMFTHEWHEDFAPQSGTAWMSLGKAGDAERERIVENGLDACEDLAPDTVVRVDDGVTVAQLMHYLTNEPRHAEAAPAPAARAASSPAAVAWLAEGKTRYSRLVNDHYGSPDTIAAGGGLSLRGGDVAAALFFFQKSINLLHTLYTFSDFENRRPGQADQPILAAYVDTLDEVLGQHPDAPVDESVREVTHRLRAISTRCRSYGLDGSQYDDALRNLAAVAPDVDVRDIVWQ